MAGAASRAPRQPAAVGPAVRGHGRHRGGRGLGGGQPGRQNRLHHRVQLRRQGHKRELRQVAYNAAAGARQWAGPAPLPARRSHTSVHYLSKIADSGWLTGSSDGRPVVRRLSKSGCRAACSGGAPRAAPSGISLALRAETTPGPADRPAVSGTPTRAAAPQVRATQIPAGRLTTNPGSCRSRHHRKSSSAITRPC